MAFAKLEPFGDEWRQSAMITGMIAETHRDPEKRSQPFTAEDFMPTFEDEGKHQEWETQLAMVEILNAAFGGQDLR